VLIFLKKMIFHLSENFWPSKRLKIKFASFDTVFQTSMHYDLNGALFHSDRGSQYTSHDFRDTLRNFGLIQSMNSAAGRVHDNAKCESMWARGKSEIMACYDTKRMTCKELTDLILRYYLDYWNHRRICSAIGGVPPMIKRGAYFLKKDDISFF
jgi:transposase InsO family protein